MCWKCPRCGQEFYSAYRAVKDKYVECIYYNYPVPNPYYNPPDEDIRIKQIEALEKRVVELEAENRELKAQCAAMRERTAKLEAVAEAALEGEKDA